MRTCSTHTNTPTSGDKTINLPNTAPASSVMAHHSTSYVFRGTAELSDWRWKLVKVSDNKWTECVCSWKHTHFISWTSPCPLLSHSLLTTSGIRLVAQRLPLVVTPIPLINVLSFQPTGWWEECVARTQPLSVHTVFLFCRKQGIAFPPHLTHELTSALPTEYSQVGDSHCDEWCRAAPTTWRFGRRTERQTTEGTTRQYCNTPKLQYFSTYYHISHIYCPFQTI